MLVSASQLRTAYFGFAESEAGRLAARRNQIEIVACNRQGAAAKFSGESGSVQHMFVHWTFPHPEMSVWCNCAALGRSQGCSHIMGMWHVLENALPWLFERSPSFRSLCVAAQEGEEMWRKVCDGGFQTDWTSSKPEPAWTHQIARWQQELCRDISLRASSGTADAAGSSSLWYCVDASQQLDANQLRVALFSRKIKSNGAYGKPVRYSAVRRQIPQVAADANERRLLTALVGGGTGASYMYNSSEFQQNNEFCLTRDLAQIVGPWLTQTGRWGWTLEASRTFDELTPLTWDDGAEWRVRLVVEAEEGGRRRLVGRLWRADESVELSEVVAAFRTGLVLFTDRLALLRPADVDWVKTLQRQPVVDFEEHDTRRILAWLAPLPDLPELELLPAASEIGSDAQVVVGSPNGRIEIRPSERRSRELASHLYFTYGEVEFDVASNLTAVWDEEMGCLWRRNAAAEASLLEPLRQLGLLRDETGGSTSAGRSGQTSEHFFDAGLLPQVVTTLAGAGWTVVAEGKLLRHASASRISVASNLDWFDLHAEVDFGGVKAQLPALLEALRRKVRYVQLGDGSHGILPSEWLERYAGLAELAEESAEGLRFSRSQAVLLDLMLAEQEEAQVELDARFVRYRDQLLKFRGVKPVKEPRTFRGELRAYQREGLGWLRFLREFGLGGCLADDMGLGKTIQVLAMIEGRRTRRVEADELRRPSLAVVPRSLIFNWINESQKFTPNVRIVNYTGTGREALREALVECDLALTTYGTLVRDVDFLRSVHLDYAILDESQAIKNAGSQASRAARLLRSDYRLAMTGTPIENHLGELWALIQFLNPGMLGRVSTFRQNFSSEAKEGSLQKLRQAMAPLMLRRTKKQVLDQLPGKTEQTLYCDMTPSQAARYRELHAYYYAQLSDKVAELGMAKSKIHILEALLRLRQAACDPRLLDRRKQPPGAKLELLFEQLEELREEGHKALIFSQFTSFLALVRSEMDKRGWIYEYLDGQTRNRAKCVNRFQEDDACRLFLISLKAGGQGLNLTAADYVFILDPWWNPAVEAQAVDRAHRMGQMRPVTAYRLVARGTVEEKILQLQTQKRRLADAIVCEDQGLLAKMTAEDLQLLFS